MADVIRTAQYFKVNIADKSGTLGHMRAPLREAGVNLLSVHAFSPKSPDASRRRSGRSRRLQGHRKIAQVESGGAESLLLGGWR